MITLNYNTIIPYFFLFFCLTTKAQKQEEVYRTYPYDLERIDYLIKNDSLYKATILINNSITYSEKNKIYPLLAKSYFELGKVLYKTSNFLNAEHYYKKSLKIYDSLNIPQGKNKVLSGLTANYLISRNYEKFDSIFPIAQNIAKAEQSDLYFTNIGNQIKRYYYNSKNEKLFESCKKAMLEIEETDFKLLNIYSNTNPLKLKEQLKLCYEYYFTIAHIKLPKHRTKGNEMLLRLNESKLKEALYTDNKDDTYRKLGTYNYYKFKYYNLVNKDADSAVKYLLKSDTYKYEALVEYEKRNSKNGELIYQIINTEQQLNLANEISKKDAKSSKTFLITALVFGVLLIATLIIFLYYIKAKKNVTRVNKALISTNNKLVDVDKNRLEFFSILSHELRTPIYGISGLATLINQENEEEKRQSYLNSLISSSGYLSILIDNILQINKLKFENKRLRFQPETITKSVNNVLSTIKISAKDKGLELRTNIDVKNITEQILIDKVAFSQILINLSYNAIRYTKEGFVSINVKETSRDTNSVTISFEVEDSGIGIKEEHRNVVFNAFENKTFLQKNSSGSGLGLYIVKTLLESFNSKIDFISKKDVGTKFFFSIKFDLAKEVNTEYLSSDFIPNKEMHVLVVDDNKINLLITKKNIEKIKSYFCETSTNGKEAISMIKNKSFDLVLMDINMPDMDGYEVTKHIRIFNPTIPIIALTALNSNEISSKAKDVGINQIITKPYDFEEFKASVIKQTISSYSTFKSND